MAETKKQKKGWPVVGSVRKGEYGSYIKLAEGVEIFLNGEKVQLNEKRTILLEDPRKKVEGLLERGIITEAEADKRRERLSEMDWLRYDMVCNPPKG
jgi:hypothetical protein